MSSPASACFPPRRCLGRAPTHAARECSKTPRTKTSRLSSSAPSTLGTVVRKPRNVDACERRILPVNPRMHIRGTKRREMEVGVATANAAQYD